MIRILLVLHFARETGDRASRQDSKILYIQDLRSHATHGGDGGLRSALHTLQMEALRKS